MPWPSLLLLCWLLRRLPWPSHSLSLLPFSVSLQHYAQHIFSSPQRQKPRPFTLISFSPARREYFSLRAQYYSTPRTESHPVRDRDRTVNPLTGKNRYGYVIPGKDRLYGCPHCDKMKKKLIYPLVVDLNEFFDREETKKHMSEMHPEFDCCCGKCNICFQTHEVLMEHEYNFCPMIVITRWDIYNEFCFFLNV